MELGVALGKFLIPIAHTQMSLTIVICFLDGDSREYHYIVVMRRLAPYCYRCSVLEAQSLLATLIETFEFSIPEDQPEIQRVPAGLMVPMVRGRMHGGTQMPLRVTLVDNGA